MWGLTIQDITGLIATWGYVIILPVSIVEGPIISIITGFLVSLGNMHWLTAFLILMAGDVLGDALYYHLGKWGHRPMIKKMVAKMGLTSERMTDFEVSFNKHHLKILLLNKTHAAGGVILYFAGAIRMPFWRFLWINCLGSLPKVALLEGIGFFFGKSYLKIKTYLDYVGILSLLIPIGLLILYWYIKRRATEKNNNPK